MIFDFVNLSAYGQALKTTSTDADELVGIMAKLTLSQTEQALSARKLSVDTMKQILMTKGLTEAEALANATKIASATATDVATFSFNAYTAAIWSNVKAIGTWMLTNPVGWVIGIGTLIGGTIAAINLFSESLEEQKEKIAELKDECASLKDELSDLESQIKETEREIAKLEEKSNNGTITLVEEDQLRKLRLQNELLKEQYDVNQDLEKQKNKELVDTNREAFNTEFYGSVDDSLNNNPDIRDYYTPGIYSDFKQAPNQNLILLAKTNQKNLENAMFSGDENLINLLKKDKTLITEELSSRSSAILEILLEYQNNLASVMNPDGTFDNLEDKELWDDIESWKKAIYQYTNRSGEWNTVQINTAINDSSLMKTKDELKEKFNGGDLTEADIEKYDDLISSLEDANLILENGQSVASVYLQYLRGIAVSQNDVNSSIPSFSFDDSKDSIDNFQSQISELSSALAKISGGSITSGELVDLYEMFPQLSDSTGDLSESLRELIFERLESLKESLKSAGASDDVLALFDDIVAKSEGFSVDNVLSQLQSSHAMLKDIKKEFSSLGYISVGSLQQIASQYPQLESAVNDYLQGKIKEKDLINLLSEEYDSDIDNYKKCIIAKRKIDAEYYKEIYNNISDDLKEKAKSYGIDLEKYKTYNEAKLELDKEYERKKSHLTALDKLRDKMLQTDENGKLKLNQLTPGDMMLMPQLDNYDTYKKEVDAIQEIIDSLDTSIDVDIPDFNTDLFDNGSSSDSDKWSDEIDWAANSINNLKNEIEGLNRELENTSSYSKKLDIIEELKAKEEELLGLRKKSKDAYKDEYNKSLNKLGKNDKNKYRKLIESDTKLTVEHFGNSEKGLFEKVKAAQEAWQAYQQSLKDYEDQVKQVEDTDKLEYETKQEETQNKIDRHTNNIQDYQNVIDKKETMYGYADKKDYQNLYDEREKLLVDARKKRDDAKVNRESVKKKYGVNSAEYKAANDEVQELQDNVASLVQEQVELNRTILEYPIHALEEANEEYERKLKDLEKQQDKINRAIEYANMLVQDQIDSLNDQKEATTEAYDEKIKAIQEEKDAYTETNDELQRSIDLENAKYNLEKAKRNKTTRIFRKGSGFVYESDQDAIRDAQSTLDQQIYNNKIAEYDNEINKLNESKEHDLELIDKEIESWQDYADLLNKVSDSYERLASKRSFLELFGATGESDLLSKDIGILGSIETTLNDTKSQIDTLQEKIEVNETTIAAIKTEAENYLKTTKDIEDAQKRIDQLARENKDEIAAIDERSTSVTNLGKSWTDTNTNADTAINGIITTLNDTKKTESDIFAEKIEALTSFKETTVALYNEIESAVKAASNAFSKMESTLANAKSAYEKILDYQNKAATANSGISVPTMHSGGIVGKSSRPENLIALTEADLKPNETFAKLLNGEVVLNNAQMGNIFSNLNRAYSALTPLNKRESSSTNITVGDVNVYNPDNTDMIVDEIVKELPLKVIQRLHSK